MQTKNWSITEAPIDKEFVTSVSKPGHTLAFRVLDDDGEVLQRSDETYED